MAQDVRIAVWGAYAVQMTYIGVAERNRNLAMIFIDGLTYQLVEIVRLSTELKSGFGGWLAQWSSCVVVKKSDH